MTMEIFAVTWDAGAHAALGRIFIRIIIEIVTGVTEEGAAFITSPRSVVAQHVHEGTTHNRRVHNTECDVRGFALNQTLVSICAARGRSEGVLNTKNSMLLLPDSTLSESPPEP